jgi:hypothetical protein
VGVSVQLPDQALDGPSDRRAVTVIHGTNTGESTGWVVASRRVWAVFAPLMAVCHSQDATRSVASRLTLQPGDRGKGARPPPAGAVLRSRARLACSMHQAGRKRIW